MKNPPAAPIVVAVPIDAHAPIEPINNANSTTWFIDERILSEASRIDGNPPKNLPTNPSNITSAKIIPAPSTTAIIGLGLK